MAAGMSQTQLAEAAGIARRRLQEYESGERNPENMAAKTLLALADALEVDPHWLI